MVRWVNIKSGLENTQQLLRIKDKQHCLLFKRSLIVCLLLPVEIIFYTVCHCIFRSKNHLGMRSTSVLCSWLIISAVAYCIVFSYFLNDGFNIYKFSIAFITNQLLLKQYVGRNVSYLLSTLWTKLPIQLPINHIISDAWCAKFRSPWSWTDSVVKLCWMINVTPADQHIHTGWVECDAQTCTPLLNHWLSLH